jgi:hypothetical protein
MTETGKEKGMKDFIAGIESFCRDFAHRYQDTLTWKWDNRFPAVLTTFETEMEANLQPFLKQHLNAIWDNSNTDDAPDAVLDAISHFGGLMPGQLMFTSEPDRDILLCFAWWPWGNGSTISIRVAAYQKAMSDEDCALFKKKFEEWFGIG